MLNEATHGMTQLAMDPSAVDDKVFAQFYMHAKQDQARTKEEARPIFVDTPYVMIMVPGDKDNIVRRPVRLSDQQRFPKQWDAFERGQEQAQEGTPLEQWPLLKRSQVEEMKFFGVHTIEALAQMPDSHGQNFMGINKLKQLAKDHMKSAKSDAPMIALRDENEELKARLDQQQEQINELLAAAKKPARKKAPATE